MSNQISEDGQSYQRHTIQLTREMSTRSGNVYNKDEDFVNVLFELVKGKPAHDKRDFVLKRAGTAQLIASQISSQVRGMFFWEDASKLIYSADKNVYVYNFSNSTLTTLSNVFSTTTGDVGFTEYLYDSNTVVICATDGTTLITIDASNTVVTCADADLPVPHLPYPVFMDGYLFLIKANTSDIYNSDLNDPMLWTAGNFISAEMLPDLLIRIAKVNNYLIAFGSESIEYFYDAANATGSPLSRNDSPIKINTYIGGLSQFGNDLFYLGKSAGGQPSVFMLKDFKVDELGSPSIMRYLNFVTESTSTWKTSIVAIQGHTILLLAVGDRSFVYDLENKLWGRWSYKTTEAFPIVYSTRVNGSTYRYTVFAFKEASSAIYYFSDSLMQDSGTNYTCQIITEQANFGTLNRKTMSRLVLCGDRTPSNSNLDIYWTDNDFQSFQGPKSINLNQDLQSAYILGSFRQRAFKIKYTGDYIMRLQYIEVDINKGVS